MLATYHLSRNKWQK